MTTQPDVLKAALQPAPATSADKIAVTDPPSGEDVKPQVEHPAQPQVEESTKNQEENKIPHSRVKEMIAKNVEKAKRELLEAYNQSKPTEKITPQPNEETLDDNSKAALKLVEQMIDSKLQPITKKQELDVTMSKYPDFADYTDFMVEKMKANPSYSFEDAYLIAKAQSGGFEAMKEAGKQEAYESINSKQSANVEGETQSPPPVKDDEINVWDPNLSLEEIKQKIQRRAGEL